MLNQLKTLVIFRASNNVRRGGQYAPGILSRSMGFSGKLTLFCYQRKQNAHYFSNKLVYW